MRDVESCEGPEPRAIAFERHECGILRDKSFDSIGEKMEPVKIGSLFKSGDVYNGPVQIISPASNVNGAVIRTATYIGGPNSFVTTGTSAPKDASDTTKPVILASNQDRTVLPYPVAIPAGFGLWVVPNSNAKIFITYDLL